MQSSAWAWASSIAFGSAISASLIAGCGADGSKGARAGSGNVGGSSGGIDAGSSGSGGDSGGGPVTCTSLLHSGADSADSKWVSVDANSKLVYATLPAGDHIADYSGAGYGGGGVVIPNVAPQQTVQPSGGDDTAVIQKAIDTVSAMPATSGIRGAVLLSAGAFTLSGELRIGTAGVVLRGSGSGAGGTVVSVAGNAGAFLRIAGNGSWTTNGAKATITDKYVPSGTTTFQVDSAAGLGVGTNVLIDRPVTQAWLHLLGMDSLVRNGQPQTWLKVGTLIHTDRTVTAVAGNQVTIDMPITDSYDSQYVQPGVTVTPYAFSGRIEQVGLESLQVVTPATGPAGLMLSMDSVINAWVKDVVGRDFVNGMQIGGTAKWVTIEDTQLLHSVANTNAAAPADFASTGQGVLFLRCTSQGDDYWAFVSDAADPGPTVVLDMAANGKKTNLSPHQRWATGLLIDRASAPMGGIELQNREWYGSGHGWAIGFGVVWNAKVGHLLVEQPPGSMNWAIGSTGTTGTSPFVPPPPAGTYDSPGVAVRPSSLYLAQLCARLGAPALTNLGY